VRFDARPVALFHFVMDFQQLRGSHWYTSFRLPGAFAPGLVPFIPGC
jgi:hypothetical protein